MAPQSQATRKALRRLESLRTELFTHLTAMQARLQGVDEAIALLRSANEDDGYDKVPLSEVAEEPHVDAATTPAPEASPTRATMRPPAPAFTPRPVGRKPSEQPSIRARILKHLAAHGPVPTRALAEAIEAHLPSVRATCSVLVKERKIERHWAAGGREIGYDIPGRAARYETAKTDAGRAAAPTQPIVTREDKARRSSGAEGVSARDPHTRSDPAGGRATCATEPAREPATKAAGGSIPLTGGLKLCAQDFLRVLQIGPATLEQIQRKTDWSMSALETVADHLKETGRIIGAAKLSLCGADGAA